MSKSNGNSLGAAARLREHVKTLETVIADVTAPSGFVYKLRKPSKFGLIFEMKQLPGDLASDAVQQWLADGSITRDENGQVDKSVKIIDSVLDMLERVSQYSQEPKIILNGLPQNENEVLASELPEGDLEHLCQWVKAGGETAAMLAMFPSRPQASTLASANRRKVRAKAK